MQNKLFSRQGLFNCKIAVFRAEFKGRPGSGGDKEEDSGSDAENKDVDDYYDMDDYDDEVVGPPGITIDMNSMLNNEDDDSPDTDDEPDEFVVKDDDNLILCGHVDGDVCMLEVYGEAKALLFG